MVVVGSRNQRKEPDYTCHPPALDHLLAIMLDRSGYRIQRTATGSPRIKEYRMFPYSAKTWRNLITEVVQTNHRRVKVLNI